MIHRFWVPVLRFAPLTDEVAAKLPISDGVRLENAAAPWQRDCRVQLAVGNVTGIKPPTIFLDSRNSTSIIPRHQLSRRRLH